MKADTIKFFDLKRSKHPTFGNGYRFTYGEEDVFVKDEIALMYKLVSIERWAKNMQKVLAKEEKEFNPTPKEDLDWEAGKLWARSHGLKKEDSLLTKMKKVNKLKKEEDK